MNVKQMFVAAVAWLAIAPVPFGPASADMMRGATESYGLGGGVTQAPDPHSINGAGGTPLTRFDAGPGAFGQTGRGPNWQAGPNWRPGQEVHYLPNHWREEGNDPISGPTSPNLAVPGPEMGAGVPGLVAACGLLALAFARRRRQQSA
jgi:hypothetical protein